MRAAVAALALTVSAGPSLLACGGDGPREGAPAAAVRPPTRGGGPAFPKMAVPEDNPLTPEKVELGRLLFHDPLLSADRKVACVTCHSQYWGMGDGLPRAVGVGGTGLPGTGRVGPRTTRRNAPTLWNAAFRPALFWDGRAPNLEAQVLGPLAASDELGRDPVELVRDVGANAEYRASFARAFPGAAEPVTLENLQRAIASFVRTLVSDYAPYDRYVRGDEGALGDDERRGLALFTSSGCGRCHAPPTFDSPTYARATGPAAAGIVDHGRAEVTGRSEDEGAMRVPTLRNLRHTGPYFHNGEVPTITEAVRLMAADFAPRALSDGDVAAIAAFLDKSLVDRTHEPARPVRVPSGLPVPDDGFTIPRGGP